MRPRQSLCINIEHGGIPSPPKYVNHNDRDKLMTICVDFSLAYRIFKALQHDLHKKCEENSMKFNMASLN